MPLFVGKDGSEVNVSGEEEVARFKAAGYSLVETSGPSAKAPVKKAAPKPPTK